MDTLPPEMGATKVAPIISQKLKINNEGQPCMTDITFPQTYLEIIHPQAPRGHVRFMLFDFDGTLSLIREGWQKVMIPYFVEELLQTPHHESPEQVEAIVRDFVERLTGKQTIYQCFQLAEEVQKRGGTPKDALTYKHEYLSRLWKRIEHRVAGLKSGQIEPDSLLLRGARPFLDALKARGVELYLASGTDLIYVKEEARALQIAQYFEPHIYGALDEYKNFSKQMIIEKLLRENNLSGSELAVIGDGYVEIENAKKVGGLAIGVASDEVHPGGLDTWKRRRLITAGADAIIPDYSELDTLMAYLFEADPHCIGGRTR
jgi:phosphoglycolate phosphatase-like HAD superfamily hydrolase